MRLAAFFLLLISLISLATANNVWPHAKALDFFATRFFAMFSKEVHSHHGLVLISPAAIQKLLAIFYNITNVDLSLGLTRDMAIRDYDLEYKKIVQLRFKKNLKLIESSIKIEYMDPLNVLQYFDEDFDELRHEIRIRNNFLLEGGSTVSEIFAYAARQYFNARFYFKEPEEAKMSNILDIANHGIDILTHVHYVAHLDPQFITINDNHYAYGTFKFSPYLEMPRRKIFPAKIVEIPLLSNRTSMQLILIKPTTREDFPGVLSMLISLRRRSFNEILAKLKPKVTAIKLPFPNMLTRINYEKHLDKMDFQTLNKMFKKKIRLNAILEDPEFMKVKIKSFIQIINLQVVSQTISPQLKDRMKTHFLNRDLNNTNSFDGSESPFIFIIKSKKVIYFMGQYDATYDIQI